MTIYFLGLDGASVNTIEETMNRKRLPNFEKLFREGRVGGLSSVYPYVTAPAWSTIFSGVNPGKHGVFDMFKVTKEGVVPSNMTSSEVPFLWDYLTWANKRTLAIGVPFMYPAPQINGIFISGRFAPNASSYPRELGEKFDLSAFQYDHLSMEEKTVKIVADSSKNVSSKILEDLRKRVDTSIDLMDSESWDAVILVEGLPDDLLHVSYGTDEIVDEMYVELDKLVGLFLNRIILGEDSLIIASDHGFRRVNDVFFLNEWLCTKGYAKSQESILTKLMLSLGLSWDKMSEPGLVSKTLGFVAKHFPRLAKKATKAFGAGMVADQSSKLTKWKIGSFGISEPLAWLRISDTYSSRISVDSVIEELSELKKNGVIKRIFKSSDTYVGSHVRDVPGQILIEANEGWSIDTLRWNKKRQIGKPLLTKKGVHQKDGVIFLYGDVEANLTSARIHDIVPTILDVMGLPLSPDFDGKSLLEQRNSNAVASQPRLVAPTRNLQSSTV